MTSPILMSLQSVSKTYVMGEVQVEALKATTLDIYDGELLVILGPSGSGKSTLLNLMGGIDQPSTGEIYFAGKPLTSAAEKELTNYRRREVGFVFQFYNLIPDLTAAENVALAAELVNSPRPVDEVLQEVGLLDRRDHFPSQLSGGEQQRVAIARAIVKQPRLLLCDEPTGALDFETGKNVLRLLYDIRPKRSGTVIIVTHNTAIGAIADRVVRMRSGKIADITVNQQPVPPERIDW
ncbi:MAG TPA: ABC transporter ATP-binding protein [Syntrophomonadaceae bacterium]|nr:ABC transporter ATP-binding protein [Syntrophomonadaceae bacterium]HQA07540.1 ABC transporter ATP-binding protein [Syntrophomonadaceae bacterium]HQE22279.1 ABC transporter ATP-binding protein [Syntrophomonadaceae bacterium]